MTKRDYLAQAYQEGDEFRVEIRIGGIQSAEEAKDCVDFFNGIMQEVAASNGSDLTFHNTTAH